MPAEKWAGMASLREEFAMGAGARNVRAMRFAFATIAAVAFASLAIPNAAHAQFQCTVGPGDNRTCINTGVDPVLNVNTTNAGGAATSINTGTSGNFRVRTNNGGDATAINSGFVTGFVLAEINGFTGKASVVNFGTIVGNVVASSSTDTATFYNAGSIYGTVSAFTAVPQAMATLTNAGLISGGLLGNGTAILLEVSDLIGSPSTLNIAPGSRIIGRIFLAGSAGAAPPTAINFYSGADISSVTTFGGFFNVPGGLWSPAQVQVFGGAPFVINGNTVAIIDPTSFGLQDRNVVDVTRTISSLVAGRLSNPAPASGGSSAIGFAPTGNAAIDMAHNAFAGIPALGYAAQDRVLFGNPNYTAADGTSIWAQGFGGQRLQSADAPTLRSVNNFYGGAMGIDKSVLPGLRLGGFLGAGSVKSTIDLSSGDTASDMVFGGLYGRATMNRAFLDFGLLGGHSSNDVKRTITNNLAPNGYEYAAASYNGWFVSPEIAYGIQHSIAPNWTLTPTARVRYLGANFAGYQETGTTTNLTVASRTSHNFEERLEATLAYTTYATPKERLQLSGTIGGLALQRVGDTTVNTVLLGQNLAFATPGKDNVFGIYTGGGFDWRHMTGVSVFGAAEFTAMTDSSRTLTGRGGVRYAF